MNNERFLKLHDADDNKVVIVSQNMITLCQGQNKDGKRYTIVFINTDAINSVTVNEAPEKIYQLLDEASVKYQFLKLHDADDNSVVILNQELITLCQGTENNGKKQTTIYIKSDDISSITVNEAPEKIYLLINDNIKNASKD